MARAEFGVFLMSDSCSVKYITQPNQEEASLIFDPTSEWNLNKFFQASRAPVAFAREKEHSGRRTQEGGRRMCSDTLNPGGEARGCSVGCLLGMPEISPFVFIAAASRYTGFLELKKSFFKRGCFG